MRLFTVTPAVEQILRSGFLCSNVYQMCIREGLPEAQTRQMYHQRSGKDLNDYIRLRERFMACAGTGECPADLFTAMSSSHWREVQRIHNVWFWNSLGKAKEDNEIMARRGTKVILEVDVAQPQVTMQTMYQRVWRADHPTNVYLGPDPINVADCLRAMYYPNDMQGLGSIRGLLPPNTPAIPF